MIGLNVGGNMVAGNIVSSNSLESFRPLVIIESPYAGEGEPGSDLYKETLRQNILYAREAVRDSLMRGESPIASHLLYTQEGILDDTIPEERQHGIDAGLAWRRVADMSAVYVDRGISRGMRYGIAAAEKSGLKLVYRQIRAFPGRAH